MFYTHHHGGAFQCHLWCQNLQQGSARLLLLRATETARCCQLWTSLLHVINISPDIPLRGWLGSKHWLTDCHQYHGQSKPKGAWEVLQQMYLMSNGQPASQEGPGCTDHRPFLWMGGWSFITLGACEGIQACTQDFVVSFSAATQDRLKAKVLT